jgi:hypothetical protein
MSEYMDDKAHGFRELFHTDGTKYEENNKI